MDDVTLQITVNGAGNPEAVGKLVADAMALREPEIRHILPAGYKCEECFNGDGSHASSCSYAGVRPQ